MRFYQQKKVFTAITIIVALFFAGCNNSGSKKMPASTIVTHEFPNTNWAFEEEALLMDFDIADTSKDYSITLNLDFDTTVVSLKNIPLSISLRTSDGMESTVSSRFNLDKLTNPEIRMLGRGSVATTKVVIFPKRKFRAAEGHQLYIYRRAEKADNFGFIKLTAEIAPVK